MSCDTTLLSSFHYFQACNHTPSALEFQVHRLSGRTPISTPRGSPNAPSSCEGRSHQSHIKWKATIWKTPGILSSIWYGSWEKRYLHYIAGSSQTIYAFPWIVRSLFSYLFINLTDVMMHQPLHRLRGRGFVDLVASRRWPELNKHYLGWSKTY